MIVLAFYVFKEIQMQVYVLTRDINEYNQDGEYFVKVFAEKPSKQQLLDVGVPEDQAKGLLQDKEFTGDAYECFHLSCETI